MRQFLAFLAILACVALFIWAMEKGFDGQEVVECHQWEQQAKDFPNFYLTHWQDDQCRAHGIVIDTTVVGK